MNEYEKNFLKYMEISKVDKFDVLLELIKVNSVTSPTEKKSNAVIMLGFSGNGKSTWIKNFVKVNPEYKIISMDDVVRTFYMQFNKSPSQVEIIKNFGHYIDFYCKNGVPVIIDGNFLNLCTRMALVDTLHCYGYNVSLVDLTSDITKTLPKRIIDVILREQNLTLSDIDIESLMQSDVYKRKKDEILDYFEKERKSGFYDIQVKHGAISFGVDSVFSSDVSYEDVGKFVPRKI